MNSITPVRRSIVHNPYAEQFGVYLWATEDDKLVCDEDGNYLSIPAVYGDGKRIATIAQAARECGIEGGGPIFFAGHRQVSDSEYENQMDRLMNGLIPDDHDLPAVIEDASARKILDG